MPVVIADFVSYDECREMAEKHMQDNHPGLVDMVLGPELVQFSIGFAANVAWHCAAEATKRAKKENVCEGSTTR